MWVGLKLGAATGKGDGTEVGAGLIAADDGDKDGISDGCAEGTQEGPQEGIVEGINVGKGPSRTLYKSKLLFLTAFLQSNASIFSPNSHLQIHVETAVSSVHFELPTLPKIKSLVIF